MMREPLNDTDLDALLYASSPYLEDGRTPSTDAGAGVDPGRRVVSRRTRWTAQVVAVVATAGVLVVAGVSIGVLATRPPVTSPPPPVTDSYADLDQAPSDQDALPASVEQPTSIDADLVRFVTSDDDWSIWIAAGTNPAEVCLILYAPTDTAITLTTSCGNAADGFTVSAGGPGGEFEVLPNGTTPPDNTTALSNNVYRTNTN